MGAKYSLVVPDKVVKGMGGNTFEMEVIASGWFAQCGGSDGLQEVWFYETGKEKSIGAVYKLPLKRFQNSGATTPIDVRLGSFKDGKTYFAKLWNSSGWFAKCLCQSESFRVVNFETMMTEKMATMASIQASASAQREAKNTAILKAAIKKEQTETMERKRAAAIEDLNLTRTELKIMRKYFNELDDDANNCVDISELKKFLKSKGVKASGATLQSMINEADVDKNGSINFNEFCQVMSNAGNMTASKNWGVIWDEIKGELEGDTSRAKAPIKTDKSKKRKSVAAKKQVKKKSKK